MNVQGVSDAANKEVSSPVSRWNFIDLPRCLKQDQRKRKKKCEAKKHIVGS